MDLNPFRAFPRITHEHEPSNFRGDCTVLFFNKLSEILFFYAGHDLVMIYITKTRLYNFDPLILRMQIYQQCMQQALFFLIIFGFFVENHLLANTKFTFSN